MITLPVLSQHTAPDARASRAVATARRGRAKRGRTREKIIVILESGSWCRCKCAVGDELSVRPEVCPHIRPPFYTCSPCSSQASIATHISVLVHDNMAASYCAMRVGEAIRRRERKSGARRTRRSVHLSRSAFALSSGAVCHETVVCCTFTRMPLHVRFTMSMLSPCRVYDGNKIRGPPTSQGQALQISPMGFRARGSCSSALSLVCFDLDLAYP